MRTKITFNLDDAHRAKPDYLYNALKEVILDNNRFPWAVREIGSNYIITRGGAHDAASYVQRVYSNIPGVISHSEKEYE